MSTRHGLAHGVREAQVDRVLPFPVTPQDGDASAAPPARRAAPAPLCSAVSVTASVARWPARRGRGLASGSRSTVAVEIVTSPSSPASRRRRGHAVGGQRRSARVRPGPRAPRARPPARCRLRRRPGRRELGDRGLEGVVRPRATGAASASASRRVRPRTGDPPRQRDRRRRHQRRLVDDAAGFRFAASMPGRADQRDDEAGRRAPPRGTLTRTPGTSVCRQHDIGQRPRRGTGSATATVRLMGSPLEP